MCSTLCARTFSCGTQGSPDVTNQILRKEDSAQQGVSSVPSHAQITACSLHSGGEGGPKSRLASLLASLVG